MTFQYKRVLLVGATSGIGAALADKYISDGSFVIAVGRRQSRLDEFVKKHGAEKASAIQYDVSDHRGRDAFVQKVVEDYPDLDCVFLNAGYQRPVNLSKPHEVDLEAMHGEIDTNYTAIVNLALGFLGHLKERTYPTALIFTISALALIPAPHVPSYCASKSALLAFVDCLRAQNRESNVKIVGILAPAVQTELHDYQGKEKGRAMGMPLDAFTQECWAKLTEGQESFLVGAPFGEDLAQIMETRTKLFNMVSQRVLASSKE